MINDHGVEVINGYMIFESRPDGRNSRVIMGGIWKGDSMEFVVARAALREEAPNEWHHGFYTRNLETAMHNFKTR